MTVMGEAKVSVIVEGWRDSVPQPVYGCSPKMTFEVNVDDDAFWCVVLCDDSPMLVFGSSFRELLSRLKSVLRGVFEAEARRWLKRYDKVRMKWWVMFEAEKIIEDEVTLYRGEVG